MPSMVGASRRRGLEVLAESQAVDHTGDEVTDELTLQTIPA